MRQGFRMRRAMRADLERVMAILSARERWLREELASDQWAGTGQWRLLMQYLIRHGLVWVLEDEASRDLLGTISVSTEPDFEFWLPDEHETPALYLSKLATAPERSGEELGREMLDWAVAHAGQIGVKVVRLDTWKTSKALQEYYKDRGWTYVRTVSLDHRQSGALFEHPASPLIRPWQPAELRRQRPLAASILSPRSAVAAGS